MNVVAYCRVSTDEQDQLNSLKTQREFFEAYAEKNALSLIRVYSDRGISGTKTKNRAGFLQMMCDAESGAFSAVLFKDVSRLARNTADFLSCYRKLQELGIKMYFLSYNMANTDTSEFYLTLLAAIAQEESYNTSRRIKFSKHHNAERGKVPNLVFGYDKTNGEYFDLAINEKEAEIVKKIFGMYTQKGEGTLKIASYLNENGIKTKKGCAWTPNAVLRILKNGLYTGKISNGKQEIVNFPNSKRVDKPENEWIVTEKPHLRIISDETYEKARALMGERAAAQNTNRHSNKHIFSTLIRCAECGYSFRRLVTTYQNTYVRWVCSHRNGQGASSCENAVSIDEEELICALRDYFFSILQNKEKYIEKEKEKFRKRYEENESEKKKNELSGKLAEAEKYKEKMLALFVNDLITLEELNAKLARVKEEIPRMENELRLLSQDIQSPATLEKALNKIFRHIEKITDIRALSNAELKEIIEEITVCKDGKAEIKLKELR